MTSACRQPEYMPSNVSSPGLSILKPVADMGSASTREVASSAEAPLWVC